MTDTDEARAEMGQQIRAAGKLLGWSRERLASMAELTMADLIHLERGTVGRRPPALETVRRVLEAAGSEFSPKTGDGRPTETQAQEEVRRGPPAGDNPKDPLDD